MGALVKIRESGYIAPEPQAQPEPEEVDPNAKPDPEVLKQEAAAKEREELMAVMTGETIEEKKMKQISDDNDGWKTASVSKDKWMLMNSSKFHLRRHQCEPSEGCTTHLSLVQIIKESYPTKAKELEEVPDLLQETV